MIISNRSTPNDVSASLSLPQLGLRQLETDDLNAHDLEILQFVLVVGGGKGGSCSPENDLNSLNAGSIVVEYSTDGGIEWTLLQELLPEEYRRPRWVCGGRVRGGGRGAGGIGYRGRGWDGDGRRGGGLKKRREGGGRTCVCVYLCGCPLW